LAVLRLQLDRRAIAKYQTAETVPFRLVLPVLALGNLRKTAGFRPAVSASSLSRRHTAALIH
jgi:hypothetical protein